jgi:hypothetical protein
MSLAHAPSPIPYDQYQREIAAKDRQIEALARRLRQRQDQEAWRRSVASVPTKTLNASEKVALCDLYAVNAGRRHHGKSLDKPLYIEGRAQRNGLSAGTYGAALKSLHAAGVIVRTETRDEKGNLRVIAKPTELFHDVSKIVAANERNYGYRARRCPNHPDATITEIVDQRLVKLTRETITRTWSCDECGKQTARETDVHEYDVETVDQSQEKVSETHLTDCSMVVGKPPHTHSSNEMGDGADLLIREVADVVDDQHLPETHLTDCEVASLSDKNDPDMLDEALAYAAQGWYVFPCHTPTAGGCSCGKADCDDVGKHPRTPHGFKDATTDPDVLQQWWTKWPDANIGIATGASGLVVIDPDAEGLDAWDAKAAEHYEIAETLTARTGGGGLHLVYRMPEGVSIRATTGTLPPDIHVRGQDHYIIAAPSLHKDGKRYGWINNLPVAPLPAVLLKMLLPEPKNRPVQPLRSTNRQCITSGTPILEGQRNTALFKVATACRGKLGMNEDEIYAALQDANAQRCTSQLSDQELQKIAGSAAKYSAGGNQPTPTPASLVANDEKPTGYRSYDLD